MTLQEINLKIDGLKTELERLEDERWDMVRNAKSYRVGKYKLGSYDYWDEYYRLLGYTSAEEARKWKEGIEEQDDIYDVEILEVKEHEYNLYLAWQNIERIQHSLPYGGFAGIVRGDEIVEYEGSNFEICDRFVEMLTRRREQIIQQLDAGHPSVACIDLEQY